MSPPFCSSFLKIVLAMWGPLKFHKNLKTGFSIFLRKDVEVLEETALNL